MSYLARLDRVNESPAIDYHLCLLKHPSCGINFQKFFTNDPVLTISKELEQLETRLFHLERQYKISSETIHQSASTGEKAAIGDEDMAQWSHTYTRWLTLKKDYKDQVTKLQQKVDQSTQDTISSKPNADKIIEKNEQLSQDDDDQLSRQNGAAFLLSIAGMFTSEPSDTSDNVESIVSNLILKKHGQSTDDSTH